MSVASFSSMLHSGENYTFLVISARRSWDREAKARACRSAATFYFVSCAILAALALVLGSVCPRLRCWHRRRWNALQDGEEEEEEGEEQREGRGRGGRWGPLAPSTSRLRPSDTLLLSGMDSDGAAGFRYRSDDIMARASDFIFDQIGGLGADYYGSGGGEREREREEHAFEQRQLSFHSRLQRSSRAKSRFLEQLLNSNINNSNTAAVITTNDMDASRMIYSNQINNENENILSSSNIFHRKEGEEGEGGPAGGGVGVRAERGRQARPPRRSRNADLEDLFLGLSERHHSGNTK